MTPPEAKPALQPLGSNVYVRVDPPPAPVTSGGIVIPDTANRLPNTGQVVAVGPGTVSRTGTLLPPDVSPGDRVAFPRYAGTVVKEAGEDLLVMDEKDILFVFPVDPARGPAL